MLLKNDIKEELSHAYIHTIATKVGYSYERKQIDRDIIDASICARGSLDVSSVIHSPQLDFQLKATMQEFCGDDFPFELLIKNFNDLLKPTMVPRLLVVLVLPQCDENWVRWKTEELHLKGCAYWLSLTDQKESANASTKTVRINKKMFLITFH
jgi:Domain of unknown function (DUF4365)